MILVKTFYAHNDLRNFSYLITDEETGFSWAIDPFEADQFVHYIKKNDFVLKGILNSHQHFDHVRGNNKLVEKFNAPVVHLSHLDRIHLNSRHVIEVLETPGHTLDHKAFLWKENSSPIALFSGDTLFNSGVGNCHGGGDVNLLFDTTQGLKKLPPSTLLYPGHDYRLRNLEFALSIEPENQKVKEELRRIRDEKTEELKPSSMAEEALVNPFLRLDSREVRQNLKIVRSPLSGEEEIERRLFIELRQKRDKW
jgi:hydroxyacylglutathione hydrolase